MGIGYGISVLGGSGDFSIIILDAVFTYRISNFFAGRIHIQIRESFLPVVFRIQRDTLSRVVSVCQQVNGYFLRTDSVLVVSIFPYFLYGYAGLFRCVGIGYGISVLGGSGDFSIIILDAVFRYRIGNLLSGIIYGQIIKRCFPVVFCIQRDTLSGGFSVCQQVDGYFLRTDAVLVVSILPYLFHGNRRCVIFPTQSHRCGNLFLPDHRADHVLKAFAVRSCRCSSRCIHTKAAIHPHQRRR